MFEHNTFSTAVGPRLRAILLLILAAQLLEQYLFFLLSYSSVDWQHLHNEGLE